MTPEDKASLKAWAKNWHEGIFLVQGRQVLELLAENEELQGALEIAIRCGTQMDRRKDNDDTKGDNKREHDVNDVAHVLYRSGF
jgi:hypothetical protein